MSKFLNNTGYYVKNVTISMYAFYFAKRTLLFDYLVLLAKMMITDHWTCLQFPSLVHAGRPNPATGVRVGEIEHGA